MEPPGAARDDLMTRASTTLVKVTRRRLAPATGAQVKAVTTIKVANAQAAAAATTKVAAVASTIQSNVATNLKAVPGVEAAVPGGLAAFSVAAPVAEAKVVTLTTTIAPVPPSSHVADVRCRLDVLFVLLMAAPFLQQ